MSTPTFKQGRYNCPVCDARETVCMEDETQLPGEIIIHTGNAVMWCANGHVSVFNRGVGELVYDFIARSKT